MNGMAYKYPMFKNQHLVVNEYNGMYSLIKASYNPTKDDYFQQWGQTKDGKRPFGITIGKYREDALALIEFIQELADIMPGKNEDAEMGDMPF